MKHIKLFEGFLKSVSEGLDSYFVITNEDGSKAISFEYDTSTRENTPYWTDNANVCYAYDTKAKAEEAEAKLEESGFIDDVRTKIKGYPAFNKSAKIKLGE
jgi:hypothetical protein